MPKLLAVSEQVTKLQGLCAVCGSPSSRTQRLINGEPAKIDDPIILVGANESYEHVVEHIILWLQVKMRRRKCSV